MCAPRDRQLRDEKGRFDFLRKRGFTPLEMEEVYESNRQTLDDRHESKKDVEARDWARASKFKANQSPGALAGFFLKAEVGEGFSPLLFFSFWAGCLAVTKYEAGKTLDENASTWGYADISTSTSRGPMCAPRD